MTNTPASIQAMIDFQLAHLAQIPYSESASSRLDKNNLLSPTDCSGNIARLHLKFCNGLYIGTYTGNECTHGILVTTSLSAAAAGYGLLPGDGILYNWKYMPSGRYNHINMYAGGDLVLNHGGPGKGPVKQSLRKNVADARTIMVRRFVAWPKTTVIHPPVTSGTSTNPMHGYAIPYLIARGTNDYFGLITGPNESHGGAYASEQGYIKLIQKWLNWKMGTKLVVDGKFGLTTKTAVIAFQKKYMPGTTEWGQVWYDDWAKMASF